MDAMFCGGKRRSDLAKLETDGREEPSFAREAGYFGSGACISKKCHASWRNCLYLCPW